MSFKFVSLQSTGTKPHRYGDIFTHEVYSGWSRVTIGADNQELSLMLAIAEQWEGPYGILYVLVASRMGHGDGRYQSPQPCSLADLARFADKFQTYLIADGRHHLWFMDISSNNRTIYDNHDLIYAYGDDEAIINHLRLIGFAEGSIKIPTPHEHRFNREHDLDEDKIMAYFKWIQYPLQADHDDP